MWRRIRRLTDDLDIDATIGDRVVVTANRIDDMGSREYPSWASGKKLSIWKSG